MNYQIEHHLFPSISPCHFPEISKIVKKTCEDFDIDYPYLDSWNACLRNHLKFLDVMAKHA